MDKIKNTWGKVRPCDYGRIKKILVFKDGKLLSSHLLQKEIVELYNVNFSVIEACLRGYTNQTSEGYIFIHQEKWDGKIPSIKKREQKSKAKYIVEVYKDGELLSEHIGYSEVLRIYNIDPSTMRKIRLGIHKSSRGLTFKFIPIVK